MNTVFILVVSKSLEFKTKGILEVCILASLLFHSLGVKGDVSATEEGVKHIKAKKKIQYSKSLPLMYSLCRKKKH